mmetsp:Transcript_23201/g.63681  ORF Transcript_23201/g.63681 Transcript_23201/m.63681 type:complete len:280 (-) Transcript_23201:716-1555(-)
MRPQVVHIFRMVARHPQKSDGYCTPGCRVALHFASSIGHIHRHRQHSTIYDRYRDGAATIVTLTGGFRASRPRACSIPGGILRSCRRRAAATDGQKMDLESACFECEANLSLPHAHQQRLCRVHAGHQSPCDDHCGLALSCFEKHRPPLSPSPALSRMQLELGVRPEKCAWLQRSRRHPLRKSGVESKAVVCHTREHATSCHFPPQVPFAIRSMPYLQGRLLSREAKNMRTRDQRIQYHTGRSHPRTVHALHIRSSTMHSLLVSHRHCLCTTGHTCRWW